MGVETAAAMAMARWPAAVMRAAVEHYRTVPGIEKVKLGAQTHALGFYERLGFVAGDDEGAHLSMRWSPRPDTGPVS